MNIELTRKVANDIATESELEKSVAFPDKEDLAYRLTKVWWRKNESWAENQGLEFSDVEHEVLMKLRHHKS